MGNSKERQNAIKKLKVLRYSPKMELDSFRAKIDEEFSSLFLPNNVEFEEEKFNEIPCDVLRPEMYAKHRIMFYIHGGSFVGGSRKSCRTFVASLANAFSCMAIVPEFRLAPSFPFPFSVNDIQGVFRSVLNKIQLNSEEGEKPDLILAADTSGASIALGFLLNLKPKFRSVFSRLVLFSPWLDVSEDSPILKSRRNSDEVFTAEGVHFCAESYASADKRKDPLISPLHASKEQFESFPPVYIQMGEKEMFLEDAEKFEAICADAHIHCTLDVWEGMMPLFQLVDEFLNESHLAVEKVGKFVTAR